MASGGNYAQAAMQTLFGEQLRQLENQAAEPAEVNQELVDQYTPTSTPTGETTEDITRRFTEGTGATPQSNNIQSGLASLQEKIDAEQAKLPDLTITTTEEKTRPQYEYVPPQYMGAAGPGPSHGPRKIVNELPKNSNLTSINYGNPVYVTPAPGNRTYMQTPEQRGYYKAMPDEKYTVTNTRAAEAGDDIYDKQMNLVNQLQRQYDVRSKYATPSSTGIQGLIAEPIVSQPQTGYNNINEIMKRYIG
jgi:hypothetical protein